MPDAYEKHSELSERRGYPSENGDQQIKQLLSAYEIGAKLRQLRLKRKLSLNGLGRHTGLSASMLSQLESGRLVPTLPTLARIAMVFDVGFERFFSVTKITRKFVIVRANERTPLPGDPDTPFPGASLQELLVGAGEKNLSAYLAEFPKHLSEEVRTHVHPGSEWIHVLEGVLGIHYQAEDHLLNTGDSVHFDGAEPHSYFGQSEPPAKAIIIRTPPVERIG